MSSLSESKEMMAVINMGLPNISKFLRVVLKKEKLSEEAESMRAHYDGLLSALEQGSGVNHLRPVSIIGDDDGGYFSGNRTRVSELLDQSKGLPGICHSGYLLRRDDKYRWHRSWCKADSKEMKLFIYEDLNEEILIRSFSLDGVTTRFGPHPVPDSDKENSFAICGIGIAIEPLNVPTTELNDSNGLVSPAPPTSNGSSSIDEAYFAAYSDSDYRQWKDVLHMLTGSRESSRISLSYLDNPQWLGTHDSTSTSSSSFGSNRESMISTTSSVNRNSGKIEISELARMDGGVGEDSVKDSMKRLSAAKQQQPLPSPPHVPHVLPENVPLPDDDDDNGSVGTIYESIDNLVSQFDDAMRATAAAMGQIGQNMKSGGKKRKKKHNVLSRQTSFLTRGKTGSKSNFLSDKKSELERGDKYTGYLFKKTSSGSWKKRWCTLKGCVFGYYKGPEEGHGREYVVLDAEVSRVNDTKRSFAFSLMCKGVDEMFLAAEDDHLYEAWMARLNTASRNHGEYSNAWTNWQSEENLAGGPKVEEGIYSVPSSLPMDTLLIPRAATTMTPERAIETGIYSVPKFLLEPMTTPTTTPIDGVQRNVSDIYDVPRASISPDEEGIYDDPYDILDMEIYDYPPDVTDLYRFLEESSLDTPEHSTRTSTITVTTDRTSSTISEDSWRTMSLPPLPPGARPFSVISSDEYQSNRNSTVSVDSSYTFPRNQPPLDLHSIVERPLASPTAPEYPDTSSLEFGQCIMRGHLHKRERLTWTKLYCIIRNNFLECHKSQGGGYVPALKLFLPGSDIKPGGGDSKRRHALQVKHPRRDGVLVFATETPEEYPQWVKAFQSGASIQVQAVNNVEEMRISDLEMKRRWTTDSREPPSNDTEGWNGTLPRRKTYSNDNKPGSNATEEYSTDTLKRRRRFTLGKLTKKKDKKVASTPELKRPPIAIPPVNFIQDSRRSVSCEELPGAVEIAAAIESHQTIGPDGLLRFQGYLSVHRYGANTNFIRYWCVFDGTLISCFINQLDLTLTMSVTLPGSQISEAFTEAGRPHAFKVWHMETGQCIFFAADNEREFNQWFTVVTQNADQIPTPQQGGGKVVFFVVPGSDLRVKSFHIRQRSNSLPTSPVEEVTAGDTGSTASGNTGHGSNDTPVNTFYRGHLKKASNSHSGKWKERYCVVKDGQLSLFHNQGDKSAITSIDLLGCSIELVSVPRSSAYKLVFKVNLSSGDKTHTFAAPSETEMYAWVSALRDSSCETQSQNELSTGGSNNSSPALSGKASLRKKLSKSKLSEVDLVSYVAASTLINPAISGFADVQVSPESWSRFWCVLHSDCLYIYQTQQSTATIKTVVLPGYDIHVADPLTYKRQYAILLNHSGVAPVCIAVNDELELNQWLSALDRGARGEGLNSKLEKRTSKPLLDEKALGSGKMTSRGSGGSNKKGPVRADHTISTLKDGGSVDSIPSSINKSPEVHQDSVIRRFEKRIRKTHRVANQTEQKLKEHQTALLHFKKELSRHLIKLKELSESGEASAKRRLDDVRKKLAQVDKIVPYLGKYVAVNRQAEGQTVAVLKECCTMEIQKMARASIYPETSTPKENRSKSARSSKDHTDTIEELVKEESPYASLTEIMPEVQKIKAKSNYAQLDFSRVPSPEGTIRPPSVNYAEVQIGSGGKGVILNGTVPAPSIATHSTIAVALGDESSVPTEGASEGDVSHDITLTPENAATLTPPTPRHLETVQEVASTPPSPSHPPPTVPPPPPPAEPIIVSIPPTVPPPTKTIIAPTPPTELPEFVPPPPKTFELPPTDIPIVPPPPTELITDDVARPPTVPQRSSSLEPPTPTSTDSSPTHKAPPRVARKPSKSMNGRIEGADRETTSPARQDVTSVLSSVPSVMDRIKALHGKP